MTIRKGPYTVEGSPGSIKLEGPTLRIKAGDGSVVLAASTNAGGRSARAEIEAVVDLALDALDGASKAAKKAKAKDDE